MIKPLNLEQEGTFRLPNTVVFRLCPGNLVGGGEREMGGREREMEGRER